MKKREKWHIYTLRQDRAQGKNNNTGNMGNRENREKRERNIRHAQTEQGTW